MPPVKQSVNNQRPQQRTDSLNTARLGGILSRAIAVSDLPETYVKVVVYGTNRVGKTVWSCMFPKPLLLIDTEPAIGSGGAASVKRVPGVHFLKLEDTASVNQTAQEIAQAGMFRTIVIDSATSLERITLAEILKQPSVIDMMDPKVIGLGNAGQSIYMERTDRMIKLLRPFINLPCHVVITAKEKDHNPNKEDKRSKMVRGPQDESFYGPELGGALAGWLKDACEIVQLSVQKEMKVNRVQMGSDVVESLQETGRSIRRLRIMAHQNYAAGIRSQDHNIPEFIDNPTFDKFMSVINGTYKS